MNPGTRTDTAPAWSNSPFSRSGESRSAIENDAALQVGPVAVRPSALEPDRFVVGRVISISQHPNANLVRVCTVTVSEGRLIKVVFGGPSIVAPGDLVPVALPGAILQNGKRLRARNYRGERSEAMLCSANELGWTVNAPDEVMILPASWKVGMILLPEMSGKVIVRAANEVDGKQGEQLIRKVLSTHGLPARGPTFDSEVVSMESFGSYDPLIERQFVAELQGRLVGMITLKLTDCNEGLWTCIYVESAAAAMGVEQKLIDRGLEEWQKLGYKKIRVQIRSIFNDFIEHLEALSFKLAPESDVLSGRMHEYVCHLT
jgi:tRNA-binding EMAP/Myf-like protein